MINSLGLLALRLCVGIFLIHHGYDKLNDIEGFANTYVIPMHLPFPIFLSYVAAYSEIVGSFFLLPGMLSRLGALAIFGTISVAVYHSIMTSGFNIYALELLCLFWGGSLCLLLTGPGKFSVDYLVTSKILSKNTH
jgi:putative oxidoreductase